MGLNEDEDEEAEADEEEEDEEEDDLTCKEDIESSKYNFHQCRFS